MELRRLPADEAAVRRYVADLWLPYHRELEATVDALGFETRRRRMVVLVDDL